MTMIRSWFSCSWLFAAMTVELIGRGYVETVNIKETIMQHFKRKPVFGGAFEVGYPRKWELSDDDMDHYYWGIVNLICKTPNALKNEEVEALI